MRRAAIFGVLCVYCTCMPSDHPHTVVHTNIYIPINNEVTQYIKRALTQPLYSASDAVHRYTSSLLATCDIGYQWIRNHPIYASCATLALAYFGLNGYGYWLSRHLYDAHCWSLWKYHLSNDELEQIPMQTLGHHLMYEIQQRYMDKHHPDQFAQPLVTFVHAINAEHAMLKRYKQICEILRWIYLARCSWYDQRLYELVEFRLQRLDIIWHVFISWLAEFKVGTPA